jgi:hexosaminidase
MFRLLLLTTQTDETNFESVMWPRAAALAELFWTGAKDDGTYPRSRALDSDCSRAKLILTGSVEAYPRMHDIRYRMVDRGVRAEPLQPHWCALRPGESGSISYDHADGIGICVM